MHNGNDTMIRLPGVTGWGAGHDCAATHHGRHHARAGAPPECENPCYMGGYLAVLCAAAQEEAAARLARRTPAPSPLAWTWTPARP